MSGDKLFDINSLLKQGQTDFMEGLRLKLPNTAGNFNFGNSTNMMDSLNTGGAELDSMMAKTNLGQGKGNDWLNSSNVMKGFDVFNGLLQTLGGFQQNSVGRRQLDLQESMGNLNANNQANLVNSDLYSRQVNRNQVNPNSMNVTDYMSQFGVNGATTTPYNGSTHNGSATGSAPNPQSASRRLNNIA